MNTLLEDIQCDVSVAGLAWHLNVTWISSASTRFHLKYNCSSVLNYPQFIQIRISARAEHAHPDYSSVSRVVARNMLHSKKAGKHPNNRDVHASIAPFSSSGFVVNHPTKNE